MGVLGLKSRITNMKKKLSLDNFNSKFEVAQKRTNKL